MRIDPTDSQSRRRSIATQQTVSPSDVRRVGVAGNIPGQNSVRRPITPGEMPHPSRRVRFESDKSEKSQQTGDIKGTPAPIFIWRFLKPLLMIAIPLAVVFFGVQFAFGYAVERYVAPISAQTELIEVKIESGSSLTKISELLEDKGVIKNKSTFKYYVDFTDRASKLKAGTFMLSASMTFDEIIDVLIRTREYREIIKVRLIEGKNIDDYSAVLKNDGLFNKDITKFVKLCKTGEAFTDYEFLKQVIEKDNASNEKRKYILEGYLFPDSYEIYLDTSEEAFIKKLLAYFNERYTQQMFNDTLAAGYTIDDMVTLASVIEKEARPGDFAKVSAVFYNRLKGKMALQSDATLEYVLRTKRLKLTSEELRTPSGYNTHINKGLPTGPICSPSSLALQAAIYPDKSFIDEKYLFFCLMDPKTGELAFAKTLREHEENVKKYSPLWDQPIE